MSQLVFWFSLLVLSALALILGSVIGYLAGRCCWGLLGKPQKILGIFSPPLSGSIIGSTLGGMAVAAQHYQGYLETCRRINASCRVEAAFNSFYAGLLGNLVGALWGALLMSLFVLTWRQYVRRRSGSSLVQSDRRSRLRLQSSGRPQPRVRLALPYDPQIPHHSRVRQQSPKTIKGSQGR